MKRVTIKDIARVAGVSTATVSVALNGKSGVSEAVREKIRRVARDLNYGRNDLARALITHRTDILGVVVKDIANPFYSKLTRAIEASAYKHGYTLLLVSTNEDHAKEVQAVELLQRKQAAGMIVVPVQQNVDLSHIYDMKRAEYPFVLISPPIPGLEANYVYNDDTGGATEATRHLLEQGYRRIGFAQGPLTSSSSALRLQGYYDAMAQSGVPVDPAWIVQGGATVDEGVQLAATLLDEGRKPVVEALICYNDVLALGVLLELNKRGLSVPDDLALVGFDNLEFSAALAPPLTTVDIPRYDIGEIATRILLQTMRHPTEGPERHALPARLIVRSST